MAAPSPIGSAKRARFNLCQVEPPMATTLQTDLVCFWAGSEAAGAAELAAAKRKRSSAALARIQSWLMTSH